jgi:type III secretion protein D
MATLKHNNQRDSDRMMEESASDQMTRLRVLSGKHAGASIELEQQQYTLGASDDFDIYIGDWDAQNIQLHVSSEGAVKALWAANSNPLVQIADSLLQNDEYGLQFKPLIPARFGSVIICIGSSTETWASDADILQSLYLPTSTAADEPKHDTPPKLAAGLRKYAVAMTIAFMSVAGAITLGNSLVASPQRVRVEPKAALIERVKEAVIFAGASHLAVEQDAALVVVDGVLETRERASKVNQKLDALGANSQIVRRYRSIEDISDVIRESLSSYPLQVKHVEGKSFVVEGQVSDPAKVKAVLDGVQGDLAAHGITIIARLKGIGRSNEGITAVLIDDLGTSYTQTRDGVKHLLPKTTTGSRTDARMGSVVPMAVEQPQSYAPIQ